MDRRVFKAKVDLKTFAPPSEYEQARAELGIRESPKQPAAPGKKRLKISPPRTRNKKLYCQVAQIMRVGRSMSSILPSSRFRAALAASVLVASTAALPAAIVYRFGDSATTPIGTGFDASGVWLNFFTGEVAVRESTGSYPPFALGQFQINHNGALGYGNLVNQTPYVAGGRWVTVGNGPARLEAGAMIDGSADLTDAFTIFSSVDESFLNSFDELGDGFIGVSFTDGFINAYYGYIEISVGLDDSVTLVSFAYESVPGTSIVAGAIPEPSSAGALAGALALGLAGLRRRALRTQA